MTLSPADLARIVHATYRGPSVGRLVPTSGKHRYRVSAHDLTRRLRLERGVVATEADVLAGLLELVRLGCADRGNGGFAITDWTLLGQIGEASAVVVRPARRAMR